MLRTLFSLILVGFAFLAMIVGNFFETSRSENLAFNRKVQARFEATASNIQRFQRENQRLPDAGEFERLADRTPIPGISSGLLGPSSGPYLLFDSDIDKSCGGSVQERALLKSATFVLGMYNADWVECFSPSPKVSTVALAPEDSPKSNLLLVINLIALLLLIGAVLIMLPRWLKPKNV